MNTQTFFTTLLILALPLFMLGCDSSGPGMQETQDPAKLTFTITNPAGSSAQTNAVTIDRPASSIQDGDKINLFLRNDDGNAESVQLEYPEEGSQTEYSFVVPPGDYAVDLLAYRETDFGNSALFAATTGGGSFGTTDNSFNLEAGEVEIVDFSGNSTNNGEIVEDFNLSYQVGLNFVNQNNGPQKISVDLTGISEAGNDLTTLFQSGGAIGVDPDPITPDDLSNNLESYSVFTKTGSTLETEKKIGLAPGRYTQTDGKASVLLQFAISNVLVRSGDGPVYLYNNAGATSEDDVNIGGDGGIVIIWPW